MIWVELAIVLLFIFIGARIGGIGIGLAGGAGVIALSLILGVPTKQAFYSGRCHLDHHVGHHRNCRNASGWRYGLAGPTGRKLPT